MRATHEQIKKNRTCPDCVARRVEIVTFASAAESPMLANKIDELPEMFRDVPMHQVTIHHSPGCPRLTQIGQASYNLEEIQFHPVDINPGHPFLES
jgi:hypothetical protein